MFNDQTANTLQLIKLWQTVSVILWVMYQCHDFIETKVTTDRLTWTCELVVKSTKQTSSETYHLPKRLIWSRMLNICQHLEKLTEPSGRWSGLPMWTNVRSCNTRPLSQQTLLSPSPSSSSSSSSSSATAAAAVSQTWRLWHILFAWDVSVDSPPRRRYPSVPSCYVAAPHGLGTSTHMMQTHTDI